MSLLGTSPLPPSPLRASSFRPSRLRAAIALLVPTLAGAAPLAGQATCPTPFPWHIAEIDDRFGMTRQEAADAVRQAGMLWSSAVGNPLLFPESPEGVPIRFVFDERQERVLARRARAAELDQADRTLEAERMAVRRQGDEIQRQREVLRILTQDFEGRQRAHVATVESWNGRGGAPRTELQRLEQITAELAAERASLDQRTAALNGQVEQANRETERLNAVAVELATARERFAAEAREVADQPAAFHDSRRTFGPFILSRTRGIDVFRFEDREDLVMVLARQLGYGLGLETSEVSGAVMSVNTHAPLGGTSPVLDPSDLAAIRALCAER